MANIAIFRINYKSDFILTLNSDAGWLTPFCIKFWTDAPSQAYFVGFDGTTYTHCAPVAGEPTKLLVQFDDHHLPIGDLKFQIGYHFTVADFPTSVEDEVINQASVIIEVDGAPAQVMLDFNGETSPEIEFSLPAYANEAQRIENEQQRIENEQQRIDNEQERIDNEQTRQRNEETRIENEQERVQEFGQMKGDLEQATRDAAAAAENANEKGVYAKNQGDYAKQQGDYAKQQGDTAKADHERAEDDHRIAGEDHTQAGSDHTRAGEDHTQAGSDHTRAGEDHTRAGEDHTRAESDHAAVEVFVDSLGAFDISAYHATGGVLAKYADLTAALGTNGANVPDALRKGGMSVKFVQSSDNNYKRFDLIADEFTTDVTKWQGRDKSPTNNSINLVESGSVFDKVEFPLRSGLIGIESFGSNLFNKDQKAFSGKRMFIRPQDGTIIYNEDYALYVSHIIPIKDNVATLYLWGDVNFSSTTGYRFFDGEGNIISYGAMPNATTTGSISVPEGAKMFQFSTTVTDVVISDIDTHTNNNHVFYNGVEVQSYADGKYLGAAYKNLFNKNNLSFNGTKGYYINRNGDVMFNSTNTTLFVSHLIFVLPDNENITISCSDSYFHTWTGYRFLDDNLRVVSCGRISDVEDDHIMTKTFSIPSDAMFFQFCGTTDMGDIQVEYGSTATLYEPYGYKSGDVKIGNNSIHAETATQGDYLILNNVPDIKTNCSIGVIANFTSFGKLGIIQNNEDYVRGHVEIDTTYVYMYNWKTGAETTVAHGLTLTDIININIYAKPTEIGVAVLRISTLDGNVFEREISWGAGKQYINLAVRMGNFTNISLSYGGSWMNKNLWIFSDSYADIFQEYLFTNNFRNYTMDSHSGRRATGGVSSLKFGLQYGKPKTILWMLGMNNSENGEMNDDWLSATNELMRICSREGINLIFTTIPNTTVRHHTYKNTWIKASGYPYFDMAAVLGASEDNSNWYTGLQLSDHIHPTTLGGKVIAEALTAYLPEIIC